ncbi:MAG: hypothetical protein VKL39_03220 [Leptolyngbyaceae bacterium]|nr:hypothetical protein [Leptolyngbyaceae bacterium]
MALTTAKWTLDDYHRMIDAGILSDRCAELQTHQVLKSVMECLASLCYRGVLKRS